MHINAKFLPIFSKIDENKNMLNPLLQKITIFSVPINNSAQGTYNLLKLYPVGQNLAKTCPPA